MKHANLLLGLLLFFFTNRLDGQQDTIDLGPMLNSINISWSWQVRGTDTTQRDYCILEFGLPEEVLQSAYCFRLSDIEVFDEEGRAYSTSAFTIYSNEQTFHRDYRLTAPASAQDKRNQNGPSFRVNIRSPRKDIKAFSAYGMLETVDLSLDDSATVEFSILQWQELYEALLAHEVEMVFTNHSRNMVEQLANQGSMMSPGSQERLNSFMEKNSSMLHDPLFPEMANFILDDPEKRILKLEILAPDGEPLPAESSRTNMGGVVYELLNFDTPLSGKERVRVTLATPATQANYPIQAEKLLLPW